MWRGYVMQLFEDRPLLALGVSTVGFGLLHLVSRGGQENLTDRLLYLLVPFGFGFCAATLVLLTRSLWPAVGIHGGSHVGTMLVNLTGAGDTGRWAWILVGLGFFLVGGVVLAIWHRRTGGRGPVVFEH